MHQNILIINDRLERTNTWKHNYSCGMQWLMN